VYRQFTEFVWALCPYLLIAEQFSSLFLVRKLDCKSGVGELKYCRSYFVQGQKHTLNFLR